MKMNQVEDCGEFCDNSDNDPSSCDEFSDSEMQFDISFGGPSSNHSSIDEPSTSHEITFSAPRTEEDSSDEDVGKAEEWHIKIEVVENDVVKTENSEDSEVGQDRKEQSLPKKARTENNPTGQAGNKNKNTATTASVTCNWGPRFDVNSGVRPEVAAALVNASPGEFYSAFVDKHVIDMIVDQTNLYATQLLMETDALPHSRLQKWEPTHDTEIRKFLGLVMWMGTVKMPSLSCYWSKNRLYRNSFAPSVITRNRFELLLRMVHFAENEQCPDGDRLHKVRDLVDVLNENFKNVYAPDESLMLFRGRLITKQYLKPKRHKYGIKIFKLCAGTGFTYSLKIYNGKNLDEGKTVPESVVLELANDLLNAERTICTDIAELDKQTTLIGTLCSNSKGNSPEVIKKELQKGETCVNENDNGKAIQKWEDKRDILMLSTKHSNEMIVVDYNKAKCSVDLSDQVASYSSPLRKSLKWYRKLAFDLILHTALVNAQVIYKAVTASNISITEFREKVIEYLVDIERTEEQLPPKPSRHVLTIKEGGARNVRRHCRICYNTISKSEGRKVALNKTKKVSTYCAGCDEQPFMCLQCYNSFHKK